MTTLTIKQLKSFSILAGLAFCAISSQAQSFPTTGTCALLYNEPVPYGHSTLPVQKSHTAMAEFDFTAMTAKIFVVDVNFDTASNHAVPPPGAVTDAFTFVPGPFSPSPGFRQIQLTTSGKKFNLYAKSSQKVLLVQGVNIKGSGVCLF
jgi:hypothetical protein